MTAIGADPDALDGLAVEFDRAARSLGATRSRLDVHITACRWSGVDATRFRRTWHTSTAPTLASSSTGMAVLADVLRNQARQQRLASDPPAVPATNPVLWAGPVPVNHASPLAGHVAIADAVPWYAAVPRHDPDRQLIVLDPRGDGRAIEVFGDLRTASRIGIWVPGVGSTIADFVDPGSLGASTIWSGSQDLAMIEWLDYDPPDTILHAAVEMGHGAIAAGSALNGFIDQLRADLPDGAARTIIIGGHSYGATVAAAAAAVGSSADTVVLAGAPGVPVTSVDAMTLNGEPGSPGSVFVAANTIDPVRAGSILDDAIDTIVHRIGGLILPGPWSLLLPGPGVLHPGGHTLWSQMHTDPTSKSFGATALPSGPSRRGVASIRDMIDAIRNAHRYTESNPRALESIRRVYSGQYSVSSRSGRRASSVSSISLY